MNHEPVPESWRALPTEQDGPVARVELMAQRQQIAGEGNL